MIKRNLKLMCKLSAITFGVSLSLTSLASASVNSRSYDYSNPIYSEGINDTFVYDNTDSVITTKTGVQRTLPQVTGLYDISSYPIPLTNVVPDEATFELIKAENKEIMDRVEEDIKNGTLTKHKAADGQFYGTVPDDALGVEKKIYINTNVKGTHSLASYVPAGEIATVTLNDEALKYAKQGKIKLSVGMTMVDAEQYSHNHSNENRMPYLGKKFSVTEKETKVGTPFGGMVFIEIADSIPSGANIEVDIKGVVDTPYYDLGKTTAEEWQAVKDAPGIFAEIRTPYLRFIVPAKFIRHIEDPQKALEFWDSATALSATAMGLENRTTPMTMTFDQYITVGVAYANVWGWSCNLPPSWATDIFDYNGVINNGSWGVIHEINHHYQRRYNSYSDEWGLGTDFTEITNNALSAASYILYTNIAASRGEEGTQDWNKVADPYSSLKQQIFEGDKYYPGVPNIGNFMFSTFAHEIGPINYVNVIRSTYEGGTFNGVYIPPYDYKLESEGGLNRDDRYDDMAYRFCVAGGRDYTWYIQNELLWPLKPETVKAIKDLGYRETIPVQSVYAMGEVGRETGRPFYIPSSGYTFDFQKSLVSPGKVTVVDVSQPKYGTLQLRADGKYDYLASASMPENALDEFVLTVKVEEGGISHETKLNCTIAVDYNSSVVEHFDILKWDIYEALDVLPKSTPYKTTGSTGMRIKTDDGEKVSRSKGYFMVDEAGEYEFQVFGDERAAFQLHLDDGTTKQSITNDNSDSPDNALKLAQQKDDKGRPKSTSFTVTLEANKPYPYTLVAKNIYWSGWADVNIRKTSGDTSWKPITRIYSNSNDIGKVTDKNFVMPEPEYVRPSNLAAADDTLLKGLTVISTPQGVIPNSDPNSQKEGIKENIVDGDISTYFHSSYDNSNKTPFPHEYIIDLGGEKTFNNLEIYTRQSNQVGVIGDYEIFVADEYDGDKTVWTPIAEDKTRKGNSSAPADIKLSLQPVKARYLKIKALNNRDGYDITILAEVKVSNKTNVKNVIAQDSSFIQYEGDWKKDSNGAFVNGGTYNSTTGYFMYCFEGNESNIYVAKDVEVEIRVDGGKWERVKLTGSLREPSVTLNMPNEGKHVVEVRAINEEIALNMISTDGVFYKGQAPKSNPPVIHGADNIKIGVGQVATFDKMKGISYTDDIDTTGLQINVTGELGEPAPGTNEEYTLTYTVTDSDKNTTTVDRIVTVTNQLPEIKGLDDIVINEGEGSGFDFANGVTATDLEDGNITKSLQIPTMDLSSLTEGNYSVEYTVTDSDKNTVIVPRKVIVLKNNVDNEVKPEETPDTPDVPEETPDVKPEETPDTPDEPEETPDVKPEETPGVPDAPNETPDVKPEEKPEVPDAPEDGSDSGNDSEDNDSQLEIPDAIKDLIDEEVVTPLSGNGTEESPLQLDVNNVSLRKMNDFLNKFTTFEFKILKIEELDNKTKIDILITKKTTRSKLTEEIHLTFIVEKENSELVQAIKDFAEIKDEDNSTDNNPDNGEVKPEEKPEVPEETPDVKPEEKPEAPEVPEQSPETKPEAPEVPEQSPEDKPEAPEVPEETPDVKPEEKPEAPEVPGQSPETKPEAPEVPEETPDVKPEEKPEVPEVPEQSPETKPEAPEVPEETPDVKPEEKPEAPEVPGQSPETKPEAPEVPEETPDVKPEEKPETPEVPEQSPETKPEAPEVPGVPEEAPEIPDEIKDLIDTEVVTAVSGNGTKESPLQLDVNNVSSTKVNEFLNNFNQFDFKILKVEIIGDKTKFEVMLSRKISLLNLNSDTDLLNNDIYLSLIVESKNTELVQAIKDFAQIKDEDNSTDNNPDNGEVKPEEKPEVPEETPGVKPEEKPEEPNVPGETPEVKPEEKPEVPEETPNVKPEVKPEATDTPGQAPDVKPEAPIVSENTSGNQHQSSNITLQQSNKVNTLPATGNVVGSSLLASIGGLLAGVGIRLSKKKRK